MTSLLVVLAGACGTGGTDGNTSGGPAFDGPGRLVTTATGFKIELAPFEVAPGTEVMRCTTVGGLPEDAVIIKTTSQQGAGGHHVAPFTSPTAQVGEVKDCTTASAMATARFIAPPAFDGTAENLGFRVKAGQPFLIQSHYVNATLEPVTVQDAFEMEKAPDPAAVQLVDFFAFTDVAFLLPAGESQVVQTCNIDKDTVILSHFGHMHEYGAHYKLERIVGDTVTSIDDFEWDREFRDEFPVRNLSAASPLVLNAGDTLRMTCSFNNTSAHSLEFPEEMCVTFMTYLNTEERPGGFLTCVGGGAPEVME